MINRGTSQQTTASFNRRIVLDVIRRMQPISRKDIVDEVSLSPQTVANITQDLESVGLIVAKRVKDAKLRGQPPIVFEVNPKGGYSIGLSVEPGRIFAALVNMVGGIVARAEVAVALRDKRACYQAMLGLVKELVSKSGTSEHIWGIGVALPGPLEPTDISYLGPTTLEQAFDLSLLDELSDACRLPVFCSVDSVAGALGESLFGVAKAIPSFFYMHIGVGFGGSLVINRSVYRGANNNATEIGHIPIVPGGKACYCGNQGCLERYLSLHSLTEALSEDDIPATLQALSGNLKTAQQQALHDWTAQAALRLRDAICVIENMLDPGAIIIGGCLPSDLMQQLLKQAQPLHRSVRGGLQQDEQRIIVSQHRDDSALLGAAVLPIYEMIAPRMEVLQNERRHDPALQELMGQRSTKRVARL